MRPQPPSYLVSSTWATDLNYTTGPYPGTPTKVDPSPGAAGGGHFVPGTQIVPQHVNYLFNLVSAATAGAKTFEESLLSAVGQLPVNNWISSPFSGPGTSSLFAWDPHTGVILRGTLSGELYVSKTCARTFGTNISPMPAGFACKAIGFDTSGNCVVIGTGSDILEGSMDAPALTARTGVVPATTNNPYVAFDPTNNKWMFFCEFGGNGYIYQSANRTSWTYVTGWPINLYSKCSVAVSETGIFICLSPGSPATTVQMVRTTNATTSWTTAYNCLPSPVLNSGEVSLSNLLYDPLSQHWFVSTWATDPSLGYSSKVYRSTDGGSTWALFQDLPTIAIKRIYSCGTLFLAYAQVGDEAGYSWLYATDSGSGPTVWKHTGFGADLALFDASRPHGPECIHNALHSFGGFAFLDSDATFWRSIRLGDVGKTVFP